MTPVWSNPFGVARIQKAKVGSLPSKCVALAELLKLRRDTQSVLWSGFRQNKAGKLLRDVVCPG